MKNTHIPIVNFIMQKLIAKKLGEEVNNLVSDVVFLTKQVADRDKLIQDLQELANLGIQEGSYEDKM